MNARVSSRTTISNVSFDETFSVFHESSTSNNLFFIGLRLVFVLLDHTGDISSLTQTLESFIVKQGLENMLKNRDTIKQVRSYFSN